MLPQSNKGYRIKKKLMEDTFALPRKIIRKLTEASEIELKILLVLASLETNDSYLSEEQIIEELEKVGISADEFSQGMAFLRGASLLESGTIKAVTKIEQVPDGDQTSKAKGKKAHSSSPSYTAAQLAEAANKGKFRDLVSYATTRLGKVFNTSELSTLYSFVDYLCMPYDVIMLVMEYCISEGKGSLRYIEKMLLTCADDGIDTYQKAEDYIMRLKEYKSFEGKLRRMFGIGTRALTPKEKASLLKIQELGVSFELIEHAYNITIERTKNVNIGYMTKILSNWHEAGFTTVSEVELGDKKPISEMSSVDFDDFFKVAVEATKNN